MKKIIVTTTIQPPTKATKLFASKKDWELIVVGDTKTPHDQYEALDCIYLHPDDQIAQYPELSEIIGWKTIQRRNIGFLEAYKRGADIMATVDDDNIPYDDWGKELYVGREIEVMCYEPEEEVFDPLSVTKSSHLWHRGYPLSCLENKNNVKNIGKVKRKVLVQADLWNGDPDVDAIARLTYRPEVKFDEVKQVYCSNKISPFNSQNTFIAREVLPYYCVFPHTGRMDDIWASYFIQVLFPDSVIYGRATVYQDRNEQDLITNLEEEIQGYRQTLSLIQAWSQNFIHREELLPLGIPEQALDFYKAYRAEFLKVGIQ